MVLKDSTCQEVATVTMTAIAPEAAAWPNLTRAAAMFGVSVPTMSRWAEGAGVGTWAEGERLLSPRDLLVIAEQQGRSLHEVSTEIFAYAREMTNDRPIRSMVRKEINGFIAEYQRRRNPARVLKLSEVLAELKAMLPPAQFERVRARLEAQPRPANADMFSEDPKK